MTLADVVSYVAAALSAMGVAMANVMQRKAGLANGPDRAFGPRFLLDLVRSPTWLLGFGGLVGSFVLQAVALGYGQLSAVEPIITLEVPLTLLVASRVFGSRLGRPEWGGILAMTAGMIVFIAALAPQPGDATDVSHRVYLVAGGATAATIALLVGAGQRGRPVWRTACLGAAAGTSFGLTATMIKETIEQGERHGLAGVLTTWQTYTAVGFGVAGLVLVQWALHLGPLLAAQPGFTLMDPLVSIFWGVLVFDEATRSGWWLAPATAGALGVGAGVVVLARSPLLARVNASDEPMPTPATAPT
ncbi:hypothetical protein SAMN05443575_2659 [Jatrophihabitans endophyticus]|uniref:Magnesium transporter NIPA n=1 Tax=Jatrophihabitans endophyticus TaxID=1206085 RepID=A0A1M5M8Q0_9ACTN|nr:DMT family transporter [Jatrophihabitans endophyticus]SHG73632.1 hypothetical protein SAMN05443575_2659 [Jatrophihabitans endophyticus]